MMSHWIGHVRLVALPLCLGLATVAMAGPTPASAAASAERGPDGQTILSETSPWRMFASWNTPIVRKSPGAKLETASWGGMFLACTAPPPADWVQPDFPDRLWSRYSLNPTRAREQDYGFAPAWGAPGPTLSLLCLRGKFAIEDPGKAGKLTLALAYRGGAAVYVNGRRVAIGHLPNEGAIGPDALAEDYPPDAFVHEPPAYRGSRYIMAEFGHPAKYREQLEKRIRRLDGVTIDPALLRKGVNVLAVEIHRAPYFGAGLEMEGLNHETAWSTAGLVSLALRSESPLASATSRPAGIQVWAAPEMRRPSPRDFAHPLEQAEPLDIVGCRNGAFDGRLMITSDKPITGVKVQAGDLRQKDGPGVIPAKAVRPFYTIRDDRMALNYRAAKEGFWDSLADEPPARQDVVPGVGAMQSILLRVAVPAEAAPGQYVGRMTVSADGLPPTDVPVNLKVIGWKLPDPVEFATLMGVIQSPDSVAMFYKTPLWSEEHFRLMEQSFRLLGELGNKYVVVPIIARTNFGNEQGMIRWVKDGPGGYTYDFTVFDRYLDLAQKHQKLEVVCLYGWEKYAGQTGQAGRADIPGRGLKVTLYDPASGKAEDLEGPGFDKPEEFKNFWAPVYREIEARMARRGLKQAAMLGMSSELARINKPAVIALKELMPEVKWVANPHADCRGSVLFGQIPVGYNTQYYMNLCPPPDSGKRLYGWRSTTGYYARSRGPTHPLSQWRVSVEAALVHNCAGLGRIGADFWPLLGRESIRPGVKHSTTLSARYPESCWDQLNLDRGTEALLCPGPAGAMPTERFEQVRQGLQECQARTLIEKALLAGNLAPDLARRCQELLDQRTWHIRGLGACGGAGTFYGIETMNTWYEGAGSAGLAEKLFTAAAEAATKSTTR